MIAASAFEQLPRLWLAGVLVFLLANVRVDAFEPPSRNERLGALGNLYEEPVALRQLLTPDEDFPPMRRPAPGDWLAEHSEAGQTFDAYREMEPLRPDPIRRIIYLLPLGDFGAAPDTLESARAYAAAFFQLEARLLPVHVPDASAFHPRPRRNGPQWLTRDILAFLQTRLPADAFCLIAITTTDLYPDPEWNYVFGEASLVDRVGVYSFARYTRRFWGEAPQPGDAEELIRRICKVLSHETGHAFGLRHCVYFECVMNGSNHLAEADGQPLHACPVCLRKLACAIGFDAAQRYRDLANFYDQRALAAEAAWTRRQLAKLPAP